jgi:hypothetical protein
MDMILDGWCSGVRMLEGMTGKGKIVNWQRSLALGLEMVCCLGEGGARDE